MVQSPRLNYVWTLHKHHKIQQRSLECERGLKLSSPLLLQVFYTPLLKVNTAFNRHEHGQSQRKTSHLTTNPQCFPSSCALLYFAPWLFRAFMPSLDGNKSSCLFFFPFPLHMLVRAGAGRQSALDRAVIRSITNAAHYPAA